MSTNSYDGRRLTRYVAGASLARTASEGVAIAIVLLVRASGGGAGLAGLLVAAWSAPSVLSGAVVGHALDRTAHARRLLVVAGVVAAGALGLDALLAGRLPAVALVVVTAAGGVTLPLFTGGLSSRLATLVPAAGLGRAQALDSASYTIAGIAGPGLIAVLAALASPRIALAVPALAVLAGALAVPVRPGRATPAPAAEPRRTARAAVAALAHTPALRAATIASTVAAGGIGGLEIGAVAIAAATGPAHLAGLDLAVLAGAALAAGLGLARRPLRRPERALALSLLVLTAGLIVAAIAGGPLVVGLGFAIAGAGDGVLLPAVLAIRARDAPPGMTGAVFTTAASLKTAAGAAGAALAGGLVGSLGARGILVAIAATQLAATALGPPLSRAKASS